MPIRSNSLKILDMKIEKMPDFLDDFMGEALTVFSDRNVLFSIDQLSEIKFVENIFDSAKAIVLFGSSDDFKFAVDVDHGFGFVAKSGDKKYWVDKINEKEAAVIVYSMRRCEDGKY
jgi:hypothetical protein